jgi:hypothetical protein
MHCTQKALIVSIGRAWCVVKSFPSIMFEYKGTSLHPCQLLQLRTLGGLSMNTLRVGGTSALIKFSDFADLADVAPLGFCGIEFPAVFAVALV